MFLQHKIEVFYGNVFLAYSILDHVTRRVKYLYALGAHELALGLAVGLLRQK